MERKLRKLWLRWFDECYCDLESSKGVQDFGSYTTTTDRYLSYRGPDVRVTNPCDDDVGCGYEGALPDDVINLAATRAE